MGASAEVGVDAANALRKVRGLQGKAIDRRDRPLLIQQPVAVQRKEHLAEAGDGAKGAAHDIGDIAAIKALARIGQGK